MTDTMEIKSTLSVCATISQKVKDLPFIDGQLVFMQDTGTVAFDWDGKRKFYINTTTVETDAERLTDPLEGHYYFVIATAVLWFYTSNTWFQITTQPENIVFIGVELPELGAAKSGCLYVNKASQEIYVLDEETSDYVMVSDATKEVTDDDIENLFN